MQLYQPGDYLGIITEQGLGKSKDKGTPFVRVGFYIHGKINPADPDGALLACHNEDRRIDLYLTEKTVEYTVRDLRKMGWTGTDFSTLIPGQRGFQDLKDKEIVVTCYHEEYNGRLRDRWQLAREGAKIDPLENTEVARLNALFGKKLKDSATAPVAARRVVTQPEPEPAAAPVTANNVAGNDDLPF